MSALIGEVDLVVVLYDLKVQWAGDVYGVIRSHEVAKAIPHIATAVPVEQPHAGAGLTNMLHKLAQRDEPGFLEQLHLMFNQPLAVGVLPAFPGQVRVALPLQLFAILLLFLR